MPCEFLEANKVLVDISDDVAKYMYMYYLLFYLFIVNQQDPPGV